MKDLRHELRQVLNEAPPELLTSLATTHHEQVLQAALVGAPWKYRPHQRRELQAALEALYPPVEPAEVRYRWRVRLVVRQLCAEAGMVYRRDGVSSPWRQCWHGEA